MNALTLSRGAIPVVCVHGFLGEPEDWKPLAESLGPAFGGIAISLPGHGAPPVASFDEGVERIVGFLRARPPSHLVGYSMGGRLALAAALRMSRKHVRSLVIISSTPGIESGAERAARARSDDRLADELECRGLDRFVRDWYAQPLFASLADRPALLRALVTRRAQGDAPSRANALRALSVGRQPPFWSELPKLSCSILWIAGELDQKYRTIASRAAAMTPAASLCVVPLSGHLPHLEHVAFTSQRISEFFSRTH